MITLTSTSRILIDGDSLSDPTIAYQVWNATRFAIDSHYLKASPTARPTFVNKATNGATTATVAARIATELAQNPYTHLFLFLGVNDAHGGVAPATYNANIAAILAAAGALPVLWIGPCCWGELWPTGANGAVDAAIDAFDTSCSALVNAHAGAQYLSARTNLYGVQEPLTNGPAPGVTPAALSRPDPAGAHLNPFGAGAHLTPLILATLNLT